MCVALADTTTIRISSDNDKFEASNTPAERSAGVFIWELRVVAAYGNQRPIIEFVHRVPGRGGRNPIADQFASA